MSIFTSEAFAAESETIKYECGCTKLGKDGKPGVCAHVSLARKDTSYVIRKIRALNRYQKGEQERANIVAYDIKHGNLEKDLFGELTATNDEGEYDLDYIAETRHDDLMPLGLGKMQVAHFVVHLHAVIVRALRSLHQCDHFRKTSKSDHCYKVAFVLCEKLFHHNTWEGASSE